MINGDNRLDWKRDPGKRCITIGRLGGAAVEGYQLANTTNGKFPGIQLNKEKFLQREMTSDCQKYLAIRLQFKGSVEGELCVIYCNVCYLCS